MVRQPRADERGWCVSRIGYVRKGNARAPRQKGPPVPVPHLPRHVSSSLTTTLPVVLHPTYTTTTTTTPATTTTTVHTMATPSSSATSPSPALSYALPARSSASDSATSSTTADEQDLAEREERRRNLLARTELAKVSLLASVHIE